MDNKESLLREMRGLYKPNGSRIAILKQLMENDPPQVQTYRWLTMLAICLSIIGVLLIIAGMFGTGYVYLFSGNTGIYFWPHSQESGGPGYSTQPLDTFEQSIWLALSIGTFLTGFMAMVQSETIKLFIDLQRNSDRQSVALHAIFHALIEQRKE